MLSGAVQRHEKENAVAKPSSQKFASSPPQQASQGRNSQSVNPSYRNPLQTATASALNVSRISQCQQRIPSGTKRTASGLAKALDGAFDDDRGTQHKPIMIGAQSSTKAGLVQVTQNEFIDENEFDSDIDLDIEEPVVKKHAGYPNLAQNRAHASPSKPIVYPTLPRQQQAQASYAADIDSAYNYVDSAQTQKPPRSSAPLPWSSSPAEHFNPAQNQSSKHPSYRSPGGENQHLQNGPPAPQPQARPAKRRALPWATQQQEEVPEADPSRASTSKTWKEKNATTSTPMPKDEKKSMYPWNTSASAVKEQQKQHREETKKAIRKNEGDEESMRKAKTSKQKVPKVFLSEEQQHVLDLVLEGKKSVFFTGSAGTGKSVLMREIISQLRKKYQKEPDRVAVTASTGLAACNIGGVTLHSFAGIGLGKEDATELVRRIKKNQKAKHRWMRTKVLIIDEVSMVDGDLFDKLESIARQLRNNGRPFGGIQLVITGDFFQLPPVPENNRVAKFAFDAATWTTSIEHVIGLHHVFRQKDPIFAGMLNEMREGRLSQSSINAFRALDRGTTFTDDLTATELFPTRAEVENANTSRMNKLQGEPVFYGSRDGGAIVDKAQRDKLLSNCMAPESLILKKGAQVMLIKNIDENLVNGSLGRVIGFMDEKRFDGYTVSGEDAEMAEDGTIASPVEKDPSAEKPAANKMLSSLTTSRQWPVVRFMIADGSTRDLLCQPESWKVELPNGEVQASRNQIPLILAWALSIHKAQGQTLDRVKVDLGKVFEKGQAYVALSRATSMAGLQVLRFDPKKVNAHDKVRAFYSNLSRIELVEKNKERMAKLDGKKKGTSADDYEKRFVEDEWPDMM